MTLVVDASTLVAALTDSGDEGQWAVKLIETSALSAPSLIHVECTNVLRRLCSSAKLSDHDASAAHADLMRLPMEVFPFEPLAQRVWSLRHNLSSYDAWYVALAESLEAPLATLDTRLINAPGTRCTFVTCDL